MSATLSLPLPVRDAWTEQANCPECQCAIPQEAIVVTTRTVGLGKVKRQHVEALCDHCEIIVSFHRERRGGIWQRVDSIEVRPASTLSRRSRQLRADLERTVATMPEPEREMRMAALDDCIDEIPGLG